MFDKLIGFTDCAEPPAGFRLGGECVRAHAPGDVPSHRHARETEESCQQGEESEGLRCRSHGSEEPHQEGPSTECYRNSSRLPNPTATARRTPRLSLPPDEPLEGQRRRNTGRPVDANRVPPLDIPRLRTPTRCWTPRPSSSRSPEACAARWSTRTWRACATVWHARWGFDQRARAASVPNEQVVAARYAL